LLDSSKIVTIFVTTAFKKHQKKRNKNKSSGFPVFQIKEGRYLDYQGSPLLGEKPALRTENPRVRSSILRLGTNKTQCFKRVSPAGRDWPFFLENHTII